MSIGRSAEGQSRKGSFGREKPFVPGNHSHFDDCVNVFGMALLNHNRAWSPMSLPLSRPQVSAWGESRYCCRHNEKSRAEAVSGLRDSSPSGLIPGLCSMPGEAFLRGWR